MMQELVCDRCNGTGSVPTVDDQIRPLKDCGRCGGDGTLEVELEIPDGYVHRPWGFAGETPQEL